MQQSKKSNRLATEERGKRPSVPAPLLQASMQGQSHAHRHVPGEAHDGAVAGEDGARGLGTARGVGGGSHTGDPMVSISTPRACPAGRCPMAEIEFGAFPAAKQQPEVVGLFGRILPSARACPLVEVPLVLGFLPGPSTQLMVQLGPGET
jgi:hypothetical protein